MLYSKSESNKELKLIIDNSKKEENSISENIEFGSKDDYTERSAIELFNKIKENEILKNSLIEISEYLQKGLTDLSLNQDINQKSISYFEANNLIDTEGRGSYFWTPKGKRVLQLLLDSDFE